MGKPNNSFGILKGLVKRIITLLNAIAHVLLGTTDAISNLADANVSTKETEETSTIADPNELVTSKETDNFEIPPGENKTRLVLIIATVIIVVFVSTAFIVCCITQPPEVVSQLLHTVETIAD